MTNLSRRDLVAAAGAALAYGTAARAQAAPLTAGQVVDRVMKNQGHPWITTGFRDTFKIGNPNMVVKGISTSFGGNLSVLQESVKAGLNMLVTHEPTFWSDADTIGRVQDDPLYRYKLDWANRNNVIVWRNHDNVHRMQPDLISVGRLKALGLDRYAADPAANSPYVIAPTTLNELGKFIMARLNLRNVRVIGDPNLPVTRIMFGRGVVIPDNVDVKIASDVREWEAFEYARDAVYSGRKQGLIDTSHIAAEDSGMQAFADFLRPLVPEVPVRYIPTPCPFWSV